MLKGLNNDGKSAEKPKKNISKDRKETAEEAAGMIFSRITGRLDEKGMRKKPG